MVFALHQHDLAIDIHMSPPFLTHLPPHLICPGLHKALALSGCPSSYIKVPLAICFTYGNICFSAIVSNHTTLFVFSIVFP